MFEPCKGEGGAGGQDGSVGNNTVAASLPPTPRYHHRYTHTHIGYRGIIITIIRRGLGSVLASILLLSYKTPRTVCIYVCTNKLHTYLACTFMCSMRFDRTNKRTKQNDFFGLIVTF